jgi:ribulose-phosphate 3-epimerase
MALPLIIAPSLLASDHGALSEGARRAEQAGGDWLHVDIMDGHFVPNLTFGPAVVAAVRKATSLPLDVHLMITRPDVYADAFLKAGAANLTVHVEAEHDVSATLRHIRSSGATCGLALNPGTPLDAVEPYLDQIDLLLCMTVNPGFGGQAFIEAVLEKTARAAAWRAERGLAFHIEVDGGVGLGNVARCVSAGVNVLVAGTSLYGLVDMSAGVREMRGAVA